MWPMGLLFSLLPRPKEMMALGPLDHFLSFCCGRCLRNRHIKHLVRKSDVGSRYNFFSILPFVPLLCGTFQALKPKLCPFLNFGTMLKSPFFFSLSILIVRYNLSVVYSCRDWTVMCYQRGEIFFCPS